MLLSSGTILAGKVFVAELLPEEYENDPTLELLRTSDMLRLRAIGMQHLAMQMYGTYLLIPLEREKARGMVPTSRFNCTYVM